MILLRCEVQWWWWMAGYDGDGGDDDDGGEQQHSHQIQRIVASIIDSVDLNLHNIASFLFCPLLEWIHHDLN